MSNNFDLPAFAAHLGSRIIAPVTCDGGGDLAWDDPTFNQLALDLFRLQFSHNPAYRRFCEARGTHPG